MTQHAILSASSAYRWLACPPSALKNAQIEDKPSDYARQGTEAHSLCEHKLKEALGMASEDPRKNLTFLDIEMEDAATLYTEFVMEEKDKAELICNDTLVLVEQKVDFGRFVPDGFGTADCLIISDQQLHVIDFKYGTGVQVEAESNPQMMCYGLGALLLYDGIYDIETIKLTIFQPRKDHVSSWQVSKQELYDWAIDVLQTGALLAAEGAGDLKAGDHCRFCKVKANCRKRAEYNLEMAKYDFQPTDELTEIEIAAILEKADSFSSWLSDVKEYALEQALKGQKYDGFKLVAGRSVRKYKNEEAVAAAVEEAGFDPWAKKVLGITEMTRLLGKDKFKELLSEYIIKPEGKPTLVPASDKRKELNVAASDFEGEN